MTLGALHPPVSVAFGAVWNGDYPPIQDGIRWLTSERALVDIGVREITDQQLDTLKDLGVL